MSVRLLAGVMQAKLPVMDKMVLTVIANRLNDEGEGCWYSVGTIAEIAGLSDRKTREIIARMVDIGLLRRHEIPGRANYWEMDPDILAGMPRVAPRKNPKPTKSTPAPSAGVGEAGMKQTPARHAGVDISEPETPAPHVATPAHGAGGYARCAADKKNKKKREEDSLSDREGSGEGFFGRKLRGSASKSESWEASRFRTAAQEILGDGAYSNLLAASRISFSGNDICIHVASESLRTRLEQLLPSLRRAVRPLGNEVGLRVINLVSAGRLAPDPKVADAVRQLDAIRGGRVAGAAAQAGGRL